MRNQSNNLFLLLLGKCLGKPLAFILRKQNKLAQKLIHKGLSPTLAKWLLIIANLLLLIAVLMMIFPMWVMIIIAFILLVAYTGVDIDFSPQKPSSEWRMGFDGYGLYDNQTGCRVDCGSAEDDEIYMGKEK